MKRAAIVAALVGAALYGAVAFILWDIGWAAGVGEQAAGWRFLFLTGWAIGATLIILHPDFPKDDT